MARQASPGLWRARSSRSWFLAYTQVSTNVLPHMRLGSRLKPGTSGTPDAGFQRMPWRPAPMALPEYVAPVLTLVGVPALILVILRSSPQAARAMVVLVAGIVAIVTRDKDRRESCHEVLEKVTRNDAAPS